MDFSDVIQQVRQGFEQRDSPEGAAPPVDSASTKNPEKTEAKGSSDQRSPSKDASPKSPDQGNGGI
jgi:hypothetical protein